jgi:hypothetical protein
MLHFNLCEKFVPTVVSKRCYWEAAKSYVDGFYDSTTSNIYAFVSLNVNNVMPRTREYFLVPSALLPCANVLHIPRVAFDFLVHPAL